MGLSTTMIVAVPTAADSWTQVGTDVVPQAAKTIKKIRIGLAPDNGATNISVRNAPVVRLLGDGLAEQTPHEYLGAFGGVTGVGNGSGVQENMTTKYNVDIPVVEGGTIEVQVNTLDEAITAGTVMVYIEYSAEEKKAVNSMSQYVDATGDTTADRWSAVGTIRIPKPDDAVAPTRIIGIAIGVAPDQGTSAIHLRTAPRIRLTGNGIKENGDHEFLGKTADQDTLAATVGAANLANMTEMYEVNIPVSAGGEILVEQRFDVETPTASTVAVALLYA